MPIVTAEPVAEISPPRRRTSTRPDPSLHATLLVFSLGVLFLSAVMRIESERLVILPVLEVPLPGVCTSQRWLGVECPGCGLTRSFVSLGHGDLRGAWHYNPAGPLGYLLVALQVPYRAAQWIRLRRGLPEPPGRRVGEWLFWCFFLALMAQWGLRFAA